MPSIAEIDMSPSGSGYELFYCIPLKYKYINEQFYCILWGEWPSGLYSLRQVTEVKLGRVRSDFGWVTSED